MNVRLLREVQEQIIAHPETFLMCDWVENTECGTAACIGGWAVILSGNKFKAGDWLGVRAAEVLKLGSEVDEYGSLKHGLPANRLFFVEHWPAKYRDGYMEAKTQRGKARTAFRRINHFIKTKGKE